MSIAIHGKICSAMVLRFFHQTDVFAKMLCSAQRVDRRRDQSFTGSGEGFGELQQHGNADVLVISESVGEFVCQHIQFSCFFFS